MSASAVEGRVPDQVADGVADGAAAGPRRRAVRQLAAVEARRMLWSPWLLLTVPVTWLAGRTTLQANWSGAAYTSLPAVAGPALFAVSVAVAVACGRDRAPLAQDAPVGERQRLTARLLGGGVFVVLMAVVAGTTALWLRSRGGLDLGDEPGRTLHAQLTLPEILQPVALTVVAVALGAAAARWVRHRLGAVTLLFLVWFAASLVYWAFNGPTVRAFALVQSQPITVRAAEAGTDPLTLPSSWLLSAPGQYQDFWGRLVVSPAMAAWHDVYLLGVAGLLVWVAMGLRHGRRVAAVGLLLAAAGVAGQLVVQT
ncbi:hypothetical protein [Angustibacter sp. Root456]|uniref:hypothetical protein n=1 Tax=Angustibacter sp. Root456 TaxID=1736539 RepID=UPI0012FB05C2|nr:hypothetical protein [Angustibacter sp. Root456]